MDCLVMGVMGGCKAQNTWVAVKFLLQVGFNRCPFQLLRSYKIREENKRKIGQERSSMQQADYQCQRPTP